jgi:hypothetical protein
MTHAINHSLNTAECTNENIKIAFAQNLVTATSNLSALQFVQREMLEKAAGIVQSFLPFLIESNSKIKKITDVSYVMSQNFQSVLSATNTEYTIDYSKLLISQGNLPQGMVAIARPAPGGIAFSWLKIASHKTDIAIFVVYCEALNVCVYNIGEAKRNDRGAILEIPQLSGYEVHTWLSFMSEDETQLAPSVYTGAVIIP